LYSVVRSHVQARVSTLGIRRVEAARKRKATETSMCLNGTLGGTILNLNAGGSQIVWCCCPLSERIMDYTHLLLLLTRSASRSELNY
jgi:hypothetical protein